MYKIKRKLDTHGIGPPGCPPGKVVCYGDFSHRIWQDGTKFKRPSAGPEFSTNLKRFVLC